MSIPILILAGIVVVVAIYAHGRGQGVAQRVVSASACLAELMELQAREALGWYAQLRARGIQPRIDPESKHQMRRLLGTVEGITGQRIPIADGGPSVNHMLGPPDAGADAQDAENDEGNEEDEVARRTDDRANESLTHELQKRAAETRNLQRALDERDGQVCKLKNELRELQRRLERPTSQALSARPAASALVVGPAQQASELVDHLGRNINQSSPRSKSSAPDGPKVWKAALQACGDCRDCNRCAALRRANGFEF